MDDGAVQACFVYVEFCPVESPEIIDGCHHVLKRVVGFEEEALIAFHGIGRGMSLGKGIPGKAFDLPPDLPGFLFGIALLYAVGEVFVFHLVEFNP